MNMRKWVVSAALAAGLAWPAWGQDDGAATPKGKHWTYVALTDGAVGWEDGGAARDAATSTAQVSVFLYTNDPRPVPANAVRKGAFTAPDQTYDYEMRIVTLDCNANTMTIETSLYFSIIDERSKNVAEEPARPKQGANSKFDQYVKKHVCDGVKPDGAGEAFGPMGMVNAAATLEKRARGHL